MRFTVISDRGGQETNKGCIKKLCRGGVYCFIAAAGSGRYGEVCAETAAEAAAGEFEAAPEVSAERASHCLWAASEAVKKKISDDPIYADMSASAAVLITDGEKAVCSHMGDVRVYRFTKGIIDFVTLDHTEAAEKYSAGGIKRGEVRERMPSPLTRLLSYDSESEPETDGPFGIGSKTAFLICSDGFWLNITESEMEAALKNAPSSKAWLAGMLRRMDGRAPADCGNITAAAIIM